MTDYFKETLKELLKYPIKYSEDYIDINAVKRFKKKSTTNQCDVTLKALGRADHLVLPHRPHMNLGDIRKKAEEWCQVQEGDVMRMLYKGKALTDDSMKVSAVTGDDDQAPVINIVIKKKSVVGIPEAFWTDLSDLLARHKLDTDFLGKIKAALLKQ